MAGHAEYLLRVFRRAPGGAGFEPAPLENTPDVDRIRARPELMRTLVDALRDPATLARIDQGVVVLPDVLLAKRALTFAPRGFGRLANQPYTRLLGDRLRDLDLSGRRTIASPRALLRRLDGLSCTGCHQTRSIAGFHLLGEDSAATTAGNAIAVAASPHLLRDLPRRARFVQGLVSPAGPGAADARPPAERADEGEGGFGSRCGLGDPAFAAWTCDPGLTCQAVDVPSDAPLVGQCFPQVAAVGAPCAVGRVTASADPHKDRVIKVVESSCGDEGLCETNGVGFPGGMCAMPCAGGRAFGDCIKENVRPAGLRRCDATTPCRDDYICARTPKGEVDCMPPYFLFQLRVDGHPRLAL